MTQVLLDIEALGLRPGSAIIELAAVAFSPETGDIGPCFLIRIEPEMPFTADLETLEWHRQQATWPRDTGLPDFPLGEALQCFSDWTQTLGHIEAFWAWGATYDFPLLDPAFTHCSIIPPWQYHQCRCARTVWQLAFPDIRHAPRPHHALEDAKAAAVDLMAAMNALRGGKESA